MTNLSTAIYHILKKREPYNAELYRKAEAIPTSREITVQQAVFYAKSHGFSVVKD